MDASCANASEVLIKKPKNQNIQAYVRVRPLNQRETSKHYSQLVNVVSPREIVTRHMSDARLSKKFTFDRAFDSESKQEDVYKIVVSPYIDEVLAGYNCTVFAYGQTGTGKTYTMIGNENTASTSRDFESHIGMIPRAVNHLFDELRIMNVDFSMRVSYLELYNEELCDLLSTDDSAKIRIYDDSTKKGSVIIQGLEEVIVHNKIDVYKLLDKGKERRKTASTLMNAQSSRSHTVFSILVHIRENGIDGEEMLKIGKLNLVDLAGSENISKAGNEKGIRARETVNINQSLLTLGRVITALVERAPHIPYRESKLTRLLQESLGGRTKTSIIATISPGHKDMDETLSTLEYAHRAKNIQNKPEVNQKLTKRVVIKEYSDEIDRLKSELLAAREKNGIFLPPEMHEEMNNRIESQSREISEKVLMIKTLKEELERQEQLFSDVKRDLDDKDIKLTATTKSLSETKNALLKKRKSLHASKRRNKEQKKVIEVQVETEKILSKQAAEILNVAEVASQDTYKLHETIERRRHVDHELESACHRFSENMKVDFANILMKLRDFQEKQNTYKQAVESEFNACDNVQKEISGYSEVKVAEIKTMFKDLSEGLKTYVSDETKILQNKATDHLSHFGKSAENLQNKEVERAKVLEKALNDLVDNNAKQQTEFKAFTEHMANLFQSGFAELVGFCCTLKSEYESLIEVAKRESNDLSFLKKDLIAQRDVINQQKATIEEFYSKMSALHEIQIGHNTSQNESIKKLTSQNDQRLQDLGRIAEATEDFGKKRRADNELHQEENKVKILSVTTLMNSNQEMCKKLKVDTLEIAQKEKLNDISNFISIENSNMKTFTEKYTEYESNLKDIIETNLSTLIDANDQLNSEINEDTRKLHDNIARGRCFLNDVAKKTEEFSDSFNNHLKKSDNTIQEFLQSDMKTYKPTGATPSKRSFTYPRILASTSPHGHIIQRFRKENDWSDVDTTTATIDEECSDIEDGIELDELNLTECPSESAIVLNSTPIISPVMKEAKSDTEMTMITKPLSHSNLGNQYRSETALTALNDNALKINNASTSTSIPSRKVDKGKHKREKGDNNVNSVTPIIHLFPKDNKENEEE